MGLTLPTMSASIAGCQAEYLLRRTIFYEVNHGAFRIFVIRFSNRKGNGV